MVREAAEALGGKDPKVMDKLKAKEAEIDWNCG